MVIDKNRRGRSSRPALSARAQSLPTSVGAAASVNSDEASVGPAVLEQIKPDDVVLEVRTTVFSYRNGPWFYCTV